MPTNNTEPSDALPYSGAVTFSADQQHDFARLSGDFNPMHLDSIAARRFMYGEVVVHGIHIFLRSLNTFAAQCPEFRSLTSVDIEFRAPVKLNAPVTFHLDTKDGDRLTLSAKVENTLAMRAVVAWSRESRSGWRIPDLPTPWTKNPNVLSAKDMRDLSGSTTLALSTNEAVRLYPRLPINDMADQIAVLLATTRVVGMRCPGYHSVYSELELNFETSKSVGSELKYSLDEFDDRFGIVKLALESTAVSGRICAFLRPAPQSQPHINDIAGHVRENEFAGRNALVIGGSRGLGEVAAKILAVGGAKVVITYRDGEHDAARVCDELRSYGASAEKLRYIAGEVQPDIESLAAEWRPTDLLYFATPVIKKTDTQFFSRTFFERFAEVYVSGFCDLVDLLVRRADLKSIFYPSSVAVNELTKGMMEYSAAKAAGELVCDYIASRHPEIQVIVPRLPRLATDQTVSVISNADSVQIDYLVGLLRHQE